MYIWYYKIDGNWRQMTAVSEIEIRKLIKILNPGGHLTALHRGPRVSGVTLV